MGLSVQLKWISKNPSWETMVSYKYLFSEWTEVTKNRTTTWQI